MNEQPRLNIPEWTVSELSAALRKTVEDAYGFVRVRGEVSGYRGPHSSGHCYFALKDDSAKIEAVIWRTAFGRMRIKPQEGLEVVVTGRLTTYPGQSKYQIVVETLEPAGIGALMALVEERKKKLAAEGLFDAARKQLLPFLPDVIGVVTSPTGAVIRDILHRLAARFPRRVVVWPVRVQGDGSAEEVAAAINGFNALPANAPRAAQSHHRGARRRLARGFVVVQRGDRGAGGGRQHDPADLGGRPRDRRDADRFRRRRARADPDRRRRDGGAGARRADGAHRQLGAPLARLLAALPGGAARRAALGGARLAERRRAVGRAAPAARSRGGAPAARAHRQCADPSPRLLAHCGAALAADAAQPHRPRERARGRDCTARRDNACACTSSGDGSATTRWRCGSTPAAWPMSAPGAPRSRGRESASWHSTSAPSWRSPRSCKIATPGWSGPNDCWRAVSYRGVLARGFTLVRDLDGRPLRAAAAVPAGKRVDIEFSDGRVRALAEATAIAAPSPPPRRRRRGGGGEPGQGNLFGQ